MSEPMWALREFERADHHLSLKNQKRFGLILCQLSPMIDKRISQSLGQSPTNGNIKTLSWPYHDTPRDDEVSVIQWGVETEITTQGCSNELTKSYLWGSSPCFVFSIGQNFLHKRYGKREGFSCPSSGLSNHIFPVVHTVEGLHLDVKKVCNSTSCR